MATERKFAGKKLALIGSFAVLLMAAFGAGCNGFFQGNVLESLTVQPSSINLTQGQSFQFTAYGTYEDGTRSQITSGLVWTSSDPSVGVTTGGDVTAESVTSAAVTITGESQGLSGTGTVNVIGNVTSITVNPASTSVAIGDTTVPIDFIGNPGPPMYITTANGGTLSVTDTAGDDDLVCSVGADSNGNPAETCEAETGATGPYNLIMTYPSPSGGTVTSPTVVVTIG